jgi:gamma-glutamyltranspeptidase / glutathione hydrolase
MTRARQPLGRLVLGSLALAGLIVALGCLASGAGAAGSDPYSMQAQALLSQTETDLTLRVDGPVLPAVLEKVQVKAWPTGSDEAETLNFFDVESPGGVATLHLTGLERGERLQIRVHVKDGPQHNLDARTTVLRRPDLTVSRIDVPADVVRTQPFDVTVEVAEVGGDVGANALVELFDGVTRIAASEVAVPADGTAEASFRITLARPGDHTLLAVVSGSIPEEWDEASNARERELYVNHYTQNGVVATDHPLATQIGVDVLRNGGNAFDAAAAVQFALNVVQPHLNGIGGGSNIVVRDGKTGEVFAIDARETAPAATTATTYAGLARDGLGGVRPNGFAVGVPGTIRAVDYLLRRWGTTTLADALGRAITLAEDGFPIGPYLGAQIAVQRAFFQPETRAIFLNTDGTPRLQGEILKQPDLAKSLRLLARDGAGAFYEGEIAEAVVAAQGRATTPGREGKMTLADLRSYTIDVEQPASLAYGGYDVYAPAAGGSSGGVVLLESLGLMREFLADPRNEGYAWGFATRNSLHVFIEAMRLAFADRDFWLGDDRFTNVPDAALLDPDYLRGRSALIERETVMCNLPNILPLTVAPGNPLPYAALVDAGAEVEPATPGHTTHFSIIDRWGNVVVMTSTIRSSFGTGITVPGYGFLLNDSLALFNMPVTPRANPTTGNPGANDAAGGKRPMGNMTPTLILKGGEPFAGTGTLGSGFIPSVVLNVVLNLIEYHLPLQQAIDAPRMWMQFPSGAAQLNFGLDHLIASVRAMGHVSPAFGGCAENLNRTPLPPFSQGGPNVGSTGSFGVDLENFGLLGGVDSTRLPDASTVMLERN